MNSRRIRIVSVGSRGDLQPYIALAAGLLRAGHDVRLIANGELKALCDSHSVPFDDLGFSVVEILKSRLGNQMLSSPSPIQTRKHLIRAIVEHLPEIAPRIIRLGENAELIMTNESTYLVGQAVAEKTGAQQISLCLKPWGGSRYFRNMFTEHGILKLIPTRFTHEYVLKFGFRKLLPKINELRTKQMGLPPLSLREACRRRESCPTLLGYSPSLVPPPPDWLDLNDSPNSTSWPDSSNTSQVRIVTGYWSLKNEDSFQPSPELLDFLKSGPAPICVGFGSMIHDPTKTFKMITEAARETEERFIFLSGWSDSKLLEPAQLPHSVFVAREIPHSWLFPRVKAVLHHGGAGTTAAASLAGIPQLVSWFIIDQAFWAKRTEEAQIGQDLGHFTRLNSNKLIRAIQKLKSDPNYVTHAAAMGTRIRAEDGIARAVGAINGLHF